jgi:hypothetical protein
LQKDDFSKTEKSNNLFLNLLYSNLEHINNSDMILYPRDLVDKINYMFKFEYDQQDSYELYHRIIEVFDSFLDKYKKSIEKNKEKIDDEININKNKEFLSKK